MRSKASSSSTQVEHRREITIESSYDNLEADQDDFQILTRNSPRVWAIRTLALLCACALSTGSHFGREFLGPIKSRLAREIGSNNVEFSAILASYSVNNTWTPLVAGLMAARLGTARSSLLATSLILSGQIILLLGRKAASVGTMATGLFIFGLGVSPVSVVQETIIVRFFAKHGLGVSLAFGLLAGKGASFISALSSFPLSEKYGPLAPFVVATLLALFSFSVNIVYLFSSRWMASTTGIAPENAELEEYSRLPAMTDSQALEIVSAKKRVVLRDLIRLGDVYWMYLAINFLCGSIWSPFTHIAANMIQVRYGYTEAEAGKAASFLHAGSIVLYPICGYVTDRLRDVSIIHKLSMVSSILTLLCYIWLALPPNLTKTALPGIMFYATGQGFATLLLVLIVPRIVPPRYVPTALGAHKSIESTGATIALTLAGIILDGKVVKAPARDDPSSNHLIPRLVLSKLPSQGAIHNILLGFALTNLLQLFCIIFLWKLDSRRRSVSAKYQVLPESAESSPIEESHYEVSEEEEERRGRGRRDTHGSRRLSIRSDDPLLGPHSTAPNAAEERAVTNDDLHATPGEQARGRILFVISGCLIAGAWVFYVTTLVLDLRRKKNEESDL